MQLIKKGKPLLKRLSIIKKVSWFIIIPIAITSCIRGTSKKSNCIEGPEVVILFTRPFIYSKKDFLSIDGIDFTHVGHLDSLNLGDYLPNNNPIVLELNGKQAREDSNEITIGRALTRNLKRTGNYTILNGPELLTSGKLKFARKDNKPISICSSLNYNAHIGTN